MTAAMMLNECLRHNVALASVVDFLFLAVIVPPSMALVYELS